MRRVLIASVWVFVVCVWSAVPASANDCCFDWNYRNQRGRFDRPPYPPKKPYSNTKNFIHQQHGPRIVRWVQCAPVAGRINCFRRLHRQVYFRNYFCLVGSTTISSNEPPMPGNGYRCRFKGGSTAALGPFPDFELAIDEAPDGLGDPPYTDPPVAPAEMENEEMCPWSTEPCPAVSPQGWSVLVALMAAGGAWMFWRSRSDGVPIT